MRKLATGIKTSFGLLGILSAMYWALLHAKFGLIGKFFGQEALDWANSKMSLFSDILPYIVFIIAFASGVIWLSYEICERVKKRKRTDMTRYEIIEKIKDLLDKLK
jgi:hypothetical protein